MLGEPIEKAILLMIEKFRKVSYLRLQSLLLDRLLLDKLLIICLDLLQGTLSLFGETVQLVVQLFLFQLDTLPIGLVMAEA